MKIVITNNKVPKENHRNCYSIFIQFMIGDADGYEDVKLFIEDNEKNRVELSRFVKFLEGCRNAYPHGRGGRDKYNHIEDYSRYIENSATSNQAKDFMFYWPGEPYSGEPTTFDDYSITYFDKNGDEYKTEISK